MLAGAQEPPRTPGAYVLLGLTKVDVSNSISIVTGSIGVNRPSGNLIGNGRVELAAPDGAIAAATVTLQQPSTCAALFANQANGSGLCAPRQSVTLPLVPDLLATDVCGLPNPFPQCSSANPITVDAGAMQTLPPGTYGNLTVNAGTLLLAGGVYVFCNLTTNNGGVVMTAQPSTLLVVDRVNVQPNSAINPGGSPADLHVLVNGLGVNVSGSTTSVVFGTVAPADADAGVSQAATTCRFSRNLGRTAPPRTTVVAQICAPQQNAQMNLFTADLFGTFVADAINTGNIAGAIAPTPPTTTLPTTTSTTTSTTSSTSSTSTSTSTSSSSTSSSSTTTTSTTETTTSTGPSTTSIPTTTSTSSTSTSPPTSTSTSTSSSSTSSSIPTSTTSSPSTTSSSTSTSTPTSTSTSVSPPTSTTLPPVCDDLRVTSIKLTPRKGDPTKGRLVIRGSLADSGWADVDPRRDDVYIGLLMRGGSPSCCVIDRQLWMKPFRAHYGFWDKRRGICPPIADAGLIVRRAGSAGFVVVAPGIHATQDALTEMSVGVQIGDRCSVGSLSIGTLRRRGRMLVWP